MVMYKMQKPELLYFPFIIFHNQGTIKQDHQSSWARKEKELLLYRNITAIEKLDGTGPYILVYFRTLYSSTFWLSVQAIYFDLKVYMWNHNWDSKVKSMGKIGCFFFIRWWYNITIYGSFLKWWYSTQQPWGFPTKNDHFGVFWEYHHLRKPPYYPSSQSTYS